MGLVIELTCPTCEHAVVLQDRDTEGLGKPYVRCGFCKNIVVLDHRTEWDLQTATGRLNYIISQTYRALIYPLVPVIMVGLVVFLFKAKYVITEGRLLAICGVVYLLGLIPALLRSTSRIRREILRSRHRMRDQSYRKKLGQFGLLK